MITDITDQFDDVNPYDRIYRSTSGYTVKVRTEENSPTPSITSVRITGSWADDETGKAKTFSAGHFVVEAHEVPLRADTPVNVEAAVLAGHHLMVARVEAAAINYDALQALGGLVKPRTDAVLPAPPAVPMFESLPLS